MECVYGADFLCGWILSRLPLFAVCDWPNPIQDHARNHESRHPRLISVGCPPLTSTPRALFASCTTLCCVVRQGSTHWVHSVERSSPKENEERKIPVPMSERRGEEAGFNTS